MSQTNPDIPRAHSDAGRDRLLSGLALVTFAGPDASGFLQGQLTQDLRRLGDDTTLLAASNTAQGRVISVLRLRAVAGAIHALVAADVADTLVTHLRRYVLRSKVTIAVGRGARIVGRSVASGDRVANAAGVSFLWGTGREVIVEPSREPSTGASAVPPRGRVEDANDDDWNRWLADDIVEGLPHVSAAASAHFVAQMLNLDLLDAISFSKGCYTGQEIVARTQNLGRIKRRLFRYKVADGGPPATLAPLSRAGTKVGEVLQAAATNGGSELLAVVNLDARDAALELADGRLAEPCALPYAV